MLLVFIISQVSGYLSPLELGEQDYREYAHLEGYVISPAHGDPIPVYVKFLVEVLNRDYYKRGDFEVVMAYLSPRGEVRIVLDRGLRNELVTFLDEVKRKDCTSGSILNTLMDVEIFVDPMGSGMPYYQERDRTNFFRRLFRRGVDIYLACYRDGDRDFLVFYPQSEFAEPMDPLYYTTMIPALYLDFSSLQSLRRILSKEYIREWISGW